MADGSGGKAILRIRDLQVYYGESHALQGVELAIENRVQSIVGRNGMGKTTLCNTIVGLKRPRSGSISLTGKEISGLEPHIISRLGVGYVPQGRRVWRSLTVDEHLRLAARGDGAWNADRVYQTFPHLAERRTNRGSQLSGGEQQMLAIGRALLGNPRLLIMDEPTEGLAPIIVDHLVETLTRIGEDDDMSILLIEQNIGVATTVSEHVAIMVNGRIHRVLPAAELAADRDLQHRLLGVGRHDDGDEEEEDESESLVDTEARVAEVFQVVRGGNGGSDEPAAESSGNFQLARSVPNRWALSDADLGRSLRPTPRPAAPTDSGAAADVFAMPVGERHGRTALVVGTFDTKARELKFIRDALRDLDVRTRTVDLSTSGKPSSADVTPQEVASASPRGGSAVFSGDRGQSVEAMAAAFERWIVRQRDIGGVISAGGSGNTSLATAGMRRVPIGVPKIMISTVASGEVGRYVGPSDIMMMHSVVDVQGVNSITEQILGNGAHALAGMIARLPSAAERTARRVAAKPALGITMFGLTTPCVQAAIAELEADYDCLVFHATGIGGRCMESLAESGMLSAAIDVTTTEVADLLVGGVFPATEDRFGAFIRHPIPYVGSLGAMDMVNFGPLETLPAKFRGRNLVVHNPNVTLMRTTRDENAAIGAWIGERLNRMAGPVRFLIPEHGVSGIDVPGKPFHDPDADNALFSALEKSVQQTVQRQLLRVPAAVNDPSFAAALVKAFRGIAVPLRKRA
ncbi:MAG: ABC transporter permease [Hyphomicrobiales bacterium]|nr:ABC transporter permease [Hyphomicrobiales bacterium]